MDNHQRQIQADDLLRRACVLDDAARSQLRLAITETSAHKVQQRKASATEFEGEAKKLRTKAHRLLVS